jgi:uncharacterized protein YkwD
MLLKNFNNYYYHISTTKTLTGDKMKRVLAVSVALSLALGVTAPLAPNTSPTKVEAASFTFSAQQTEALAHINKIRSNIGLSAVTLNPFLNKAAENHANYLSINGYNGGHTETAGKKGFTGVTHIDRLKAVGASDSYANSSTEGLSYMKGSIIAGVDSFMTDAYHREPFTKPNLKEVGVSINNGNVALEYYYSDEIIEKDAVYPYNGQTNVGTLFNGLEKPNPLLQFGIAQSGFIISYTQSFLLVDNLNYFKLKDSKGADVPTFQENNIGTWFFYPKQELKTGEKYTASISYTGTGYTENGDEFQKAVSKTWSFTTGGSAVTPKPPVVTPKPPVVAPPTKGVYADYKPGLYWSANMLWAIEKGLISGYSNVKNPKTGKLENLLKPNDNLTEAQFLSVLFRYTNATELKNTKPTDSKWWASTAYQLAAKYKLPTKSTLTKRTSANQVITRGKMAQILASKHYGKVVTEQTAVSFMYSAGLSTGYVDKTGKTPKTYASFGPNDKLMRAHIVTFMKNYDTYLAKPVVSSPAEKVLNNVYGDANVENNGSSAFRVIVGGDLEAVYVRTTASIQSYMDDSAIRRGSKAVSGISGKITESEMYNAINKLRAERLPSVTVKGVTVSYVGDALYITW